MCNCKTRPRASRYSPADERIGFDGRETRTVMADWRRLAQTNLYGSRALAADPEAGIARYTGPLLAIRFADDTFAPARTVAAVTAKFERARLTETVIDAARLGDRTDHFHWARQPEVVVETIRHWADTVD